MHHEQAIESWLRRRAGAATIGRTAGVLFLLLLGMLAASMTFWVVYGLTWLVFLPIHPLEHETLLIVAGVVLVLLFVANYFTDHGRADTEMRRAAADSPRLTLRMGGFLTGGLLLSPQLWIRLFSFLFLSGPRLITSATRLTQRNRELRDLDAAGCAAVLAFLSGLDSRASFKEVAQAIPPDHDVPAVLEQLRRLPGVVFLMKSDPPGLTLTEEFRSELSRLRPPD